MAIAFAQTLRKSIRASFQFGILVSTRFLYSAQNRNSINMTIPSSYLPQKAFVLQIKISTYRKINGWLAERLTGLAINA